MPRSIAMKLTGHKSGAVYERYAITSRSALEQGAKLLAEHHLNTVIQGME